MNAVAKLWLTQAVLCCVLVIAVFPGVFLRGEVIGPGDILFQSAPWDRYAPADFTRPQNRLMSDVVTAFFPYYALTTQALEEGHWPLWNPMEYAGMPLLANFQTAVFYPPRLLHLLFDIRVATTIYILLKLWLCGMTAFYCARGIGLRDGLDRFFSVGWMLASYNIIWANWSLPDVAVWLPVLFLAVERILAANYRPGFFGIALGGSMLLLAGHPETALGMGLGLGVYFLARLLVERRTPQAILRSILVCLSAWALVLGVTAVQWLPFAEYLVHSSTFFARPHDTEITWYIPSAVAALWVPRFFGLNGTDTYFGELDSNRYGMLYPGMLVWLGAFLAPWLLPARGTMRPRMLALMIATGYSMLMAFAVPPFDLVQRLPVLSTMLVGYHATFALFALPLLAAIGLQHLMARKDLGVRALWRVLPGVVVAVTVVYLVYAFHRVTIGMMGYTPMVIWEVVVALCFAGVGLAALGIAAHPGFRRVAPHVLLLLLAADLLYANNGLNPTLPAGKMFPETELTNHLKSLGRPVRVAAGEGGIASGLLAPYGIEDWLAYDGLYPERMVTFQASLGTDVWNAVEPICAKDYYLHNPRFRPIFPLDERPWQFELTGEFDGIQVYKNLAAQPRAFLVPGVTLFGSRDELFTHMAAEVHDYDPLPSAAVLKEDLPDDPALAALLNPRGGVRGKAEITHHTSAEVVVEYTADAPALLVLADAWYPGWHAEIDGVEAPIIPAYYTFRGVPVPEGAHTLRFQYRPMSFYLGLTISVLSLLAGGFLGVLLLIRGKSDAQPAR